ncbi:NAD(P)/FAD-dependent oxidoreductase [Amycolatopsis sp.]|jgi:2-polyprenyl-6-methoxyphenol hydroxylase-like FAD-dependent oxidoreductase|uniref:FAD-dependent oxidoreductase n=1 Tax=Amycolatopsis sp. TaxID=37632 RepID=UPI002DF7DD5C|nr:NAD(P)/FAD-dependent oxidoreductase [Amycolatopsis sp.]
MVHVVVIGGGTGGLCLAQGLRQAGMNVAVYERSRTRAERLQGYRVHINPQGARALRASLPAELWERFVATCGQPGGAFGFVTEQLRELMLIEGELTSGADPADAHHSVSRITLHQVLSSGLNGVLHLDKEFERYERAEDGEITCFFADGTTARADVLIAADGANSRVRQQFLPHAERRDTGIVTIAGKFPLTRETKALLPKRLYEGPNSVLPPAGCGMFSAPHELGGGVNDASAEQDAVLFDNTASYLMWAYAARDFDDLSEKDGDELKDIVSGRIEGWHPGLRRLVSDSPPGTVSLLPVLTSVPVEPWPSTNITLLGDAIHSMTPFRGVGANIALRDADLLRRNLIAASRGECSYAEAIADYEREMRGYGFAAVKAAERAADQFVSGNRAGRIMFKGLLRFFSAVPPLKRKVFSDHGAE